MAKFYPIHHHLNPSTSPHQNCLSSRRKFSPRSPTFLSAALTDACLQATPLSTSSPQSFSPTLSSSGFKEFREFDSVKLMHAQMIKMGKNWNSDTTAAKSLILYYLEFGDFESAAKVFYVDYSRNYLEWNSFLEEYESFGGQVQQVLEVFCKLRGKEVTFDGKVLTFVLKICTSAMAFWLGTEIHASLIKTGLDSDVYVKCALMNFYGRCWNVESANDVLNEVSVREDLLWNEAILVNLRNDRWEKAIELFRQMQFCFARAYSRIIVKMLHVCGKIGAINEGKQIHGGLLDDAKKSLNQMEEEGIKPDLVTWNSLIFGYSIWGQSKQALAVIQQMKDSGLVPNVVSWTSLISGSSQNENYRESFHFFIQMQQEGIKPNSATVSCLLRTCAGLGLLQKGKEIHCLCVKNCFIEDEYIVTALIDVYTKSGSLKSAHEVFRKSVNKNLASWNCMIMGFAIYGHGKKAISLFHEMLGVGIQPDDITFTVLLSACKNSGSVDEGWRYFDCMSTDYGIMPTIEHYSCMVDLLGKAGYIDEAWDFIQTMPFKPDATIWGALLGSCRVHRNLEFAEIAAKKLFELEPHNSANYVSMMNLFSMSNRWEDVERVKDFMADAGVKNGPVWSWIQIDQMVHVFSAEGKPHPDLGELYFELYQLVSEMKKLGYVPDINCVYQNVDEVEKEKLLLSHTEKLAITYGLIKTKGTAPIRVIKNTRVCSDCHTAAKYMSLVRGRQIFLRDGVRFHHFREGKCSCNDCWHWKPAVSPAEVEEIDQLYREMAIQSRQSMTPFDSQF